MRKKIDSNYESRSTFCQKLFRSNDHFSKKTSSQLNIFQKKTFDQMNFRSNDHFLEKAFDHMNFRSNDLSAKWPFFEKRFQLNELSVIWLVFRIRFSKYFRSNDLLINFVFGQMTFFGKKHFWSKGLRLNGNLVKCTFD
jgi:hypothetical protein